MTHCRVNGNKPDTGPGQMAAAHALTQVNQANPTWLTTMVWTQDKTVYTSAVAGEDAMETAFTAKFPGYQVVAYD